MNEDILPLDNAPIVEAVLDIECALPDRLQITELEEKARGVYHDKYPKFRKQFVQQFKFEIKQEMTRGSSEGKSAVQALQFLQDDEKQLVQIRAQGFSFNRLAPYSVLDDYLPEIERTWKLYLDLVNPVQVRLIRLRYINRILLPLTGGSVELDDYLQIAPRLPEEERFAFSGFLNQHAAVEKETGNQVNILLTTQPGEGDNLPVILDNTVFAMEHMEPQDWDSIQAKIQQLRHLKNRIFVSMLTDTCLNLFRKP